MDEALSIGPLHISSDLLVPGLQMKTVTRPKSPRLEGSAGPQPTCTPIEADETHGREHRVPLSQ